MQQLARALDHYWIDILGITKTHMLHSGEYLLPEGHLLLYSGQDDGKRSEGVGIAFAKRVRGSLISFIPYSSRIMTARFHSKQVNITVLVAYAPTEVSKISTKVEFCKEFNAVHNQIPHGDVCILIGNINAQFGNKNNIWKGVIGTQRLRAKENDNGKLPLDFCFLNKYVVVGTLFIHKDMHKGTWLSPTDKTVSQIDHFCVNRKWITSLQDVQSYRATEINTTHYLVKGKLKLKLSIQTRKLPIKKSDLQKPISGEKALKFCAQIDMRRLQSNVESLEVEWTNFKDAYATTALEVRGAQPFKRKDHIT